MVGGVVAGTNLIGASLGAFVGQVVGGTTAIGTLLGTRVVGPSLGSRGAVGAALIGELLLGICIGAAVTGAKAVGALLGDLVGPSIGKGPIQPRSQSVLTHMLSSKGSAANWQL